MSVFDAKTNKKQAEYGRPVVRVPRNETPAAKQHRLMAALVRAFAREYPQDIVKIVSEECVIK